ncbi:MAG: hypothetical protein DI538_11625 [Azospira oryzae]|jgi:hypothetical protein|nr:MAG: hypothetical protein DI538_11625 [Azospira oryzae]
MNNILIPTDYQYDTLRAMELTRWVSGNAPVHIILLSVSPLPDSITGYLALSGDLQTNARTRIMEDWEELLKLADHGVILTEHHQYGASPSIIGQVMERFSVNRIVVPHSFQTSENIVHREALSALRKSNCKITFLPKPVTADQQLHREIEELVGMN